MIIEDLMNKGYEKLAFVLARYCYRVGLPTLSDDDYDVLEDKIRRDYYDECKAYLERSYDDDPIPVKLLKALNMEVVYPSVPREYYDYLDEDKSNSIRAVRSYEEVWDFVNSNKGKLLHVSLKMDGVNSKSLYKNGKYQLTLSRGRASNSLDYTQGAKKILPKFIDGEELTKVTAECFVTKSALPALREKYDSVKYKTSKSAAISLLRVEHELDDYNELNAFAFDIDGGEFSRVQDKYSALEKAGFTTPPHFTISVPDGQSYEEFCVWLKSEVFDTLAAYKEEYPSDGVVLEGDNLLDTYTEKNQYSDRQIALKFEQWGFEYLRGIITDIQIEQRRVYKSVRIKIEPIKSSDGCNATYINAFNPGIVIENDLYVGKEVWFERNAGAVNILIHGKRLEGIMNGNEDSD